LSIVGDIGNKQSCAMDRKARLLVLGGTGFLGKNVLPLLLQSFSKVDILTRQDEKFLVQSHAIFSNPNIRFFNALSEDLYDFVIDMAADVSAFRKNSQGAYNDSELFHAAMTEHLKNRCGRYVFISSGSVYGLNSVQPPEESDLAFEDGDLYAKHKAHSEQRVRKSFLNHCIIRLYSLVGPHAHSDMAIPKFLRALHQKEPIVLRSPSETRSFLDTRDFAEALVKLAFGKTQHEVYNLGSSEVVTFDQLAKLCMLATQIEGKISVEPALSVNSLSSTHFYPNVNRYMQEFGIPNSYSLLESLRWLNQKI
jgi:nucleoside-diphosphate-sugar epimerase